MKKKMNRILAMTMTLVWMAQANVMATAQVTGKLNALNELVLSIITAGGVIVLAWGVFEFAMGYQAHDTSQQTMSLKKIVSGLIMVAAPQVVALLK